MNLFYKVLVTFNTRKMPLHTLYYTCKEHTDTKMSKCKPETRDFLSGTQNYIASKLEVFDAR